MREINTPFRLIDYVKLYVYEILNFTPSQVVVTNGRTPYELVHNNTPDISEYTNFGWFDFVRYWTPVSFQKQNLGLFLGVSHSVGSGHVYYVHKNKETVVSWSTVTKVSKEEFKLQRFSEMVENFKTNIK